MSTLQECGYGFDYYRTINENEKEQKNQVIKG